jgi:hypothetical protein
MKVSALLAMVGCLLLIGSSLRAAEGDAATAPSGLEARKPGETATVGGLAVTVKEVRNLPLVENDFSRRFLFDTYDNPKLALLREQEKLAEVVAPGKGEFQKQVLLLDWAQRRFKKFGSPSAPAEGALEILKAVDAGNSYYCSQYASVLSSASASLGWVEREIGLHVGNRQVGRSGSGYTEHSITEIWSNELGKWVMLDPTFATYVEKDGVPLNAWEIRKEWFYGDANSLGFIVGAQQKRYTLKELPVYLANHKATGDLPLEARTFDVYGFLMYRPYTNLMDAGGLPDRMFISKDSLCDGVKWHTRDNPKDPAAEPYFPIQQASLTLVPEAGGEAKLAVRLATLTPNLAALRYRLDGGAWQPLAPAPAAPAPAPAGAPAVAPKAAVNAPASPPRAGAPALRAEAGFGWPLHEGTNTLEAQAVNQFGVEGAVSKVVLEVKK